MASASFTAPSRLPTTAASGSTAAGLPYSLIPTISARPKDLTPRPLDKDTSTDILRAAPSTLSSNDKDKGAGWDGLSKDADSDSTGASQGASQDASQDSQDATQGAQRPIWEGMSSDADTDQHDAKDGASKAEPISVHGVAMEVTEIQGRLVFRADLALHRRPMP